MSSSRSVGQARPPISTAWQERLKAHCQAYQKRRPDFVIWSDRRGGRTAYSCTVTIDGQQFQARYWYGGDNDNNAKEDAAEVALKTLGVVGPYPSQTQPQGQSQSQSQQSGGSGSSRGSGGGQSRSQHHSSSSRR